jgi:hypothetical protein
MIPGTARPPLLPHTTTPKPGHQPGLPEGVSQVRVHSDLLLGGQVAGLTQLAEGLACVVNFTDSY